MTAKRQKTFAVILFFSTAYALKAEKALQNAGINSKLIPVPRHLSSDCGVCLRVAGEDKQAALSTLEAGEVEIEGSYDI